MTDTPNQTSEDPAAIERDIRRTQDDMSKTVDKIGGQLTAKNLFNALLDKADENDVDARMVLDTARRNPVALGLIAAGTIWLISDKDSKIPSLPKRDKTRWDDGADHDVHHRDYVAHMATVEMRADEDALAYQRRRDIARSNFLMVERDHEEDEGAFRKRLDAMTDSFREKRRAWSQSSDQAQTATKQKASAAVNKAQDLYDGNPLVGGMLAAAVGAALASVLPVTRQEQEKLGSIGEKARDAVSEQANKATDQLREKKDELLDRADQKLQKADAKPGGGQSPSQPAASPEPAKPFIAGS